MAENDSSRVALGTVPGTVRGVVRKAFQDAICAAILTGTVGASCRATCGCTCRAILATIRSLRRRATRKGIVVAMRRLTQTAACRGTPAVTFRVTCRRYPVAAIPITGFVRWLVGLTRSISAFCEQTQAQSASVCQGYLAMAQRPLGRGFGSLPRLVGHKSLSGKALCGERRTQYFSCAGRIRMYNPIDFQRGLSIVQS